MLGLHEQSSIISRADRHASLAAVLFLRGVSNNVSGPQPQSCLTLLFVRVVPVDSSPTSAKSCYGPGSASGQHQAGLQPDPEIVNQLVGMGFSENGSKRAAVATQVPQAQQHAFPNHVDNLCALCWVSTGSVHPKEWYTCSTQEDSQQV